MYVPRAFAALLPLLLLALLVSPHDAAWTQDSEPQFIELPSLSDMTKPDLEVAPDAQIIEVPGIRRSRSAVRDGVVLPDGTVSFWNDQGYLIKATLDGEIL